MKIRGNVRASTWRHFAFELYWNFVIKLIRKTKSIVTHLTRRNGTVEFGTNVQKSRECPISERGSFTAKRL